MVMGPDLDNSRPAGGMLPFALDLATFAWRRGAFRDPAAHVAIPAARQRPGIVRIGGQWLLVGEGTPLPVSLGCLTPDAVSTAHWRAQWHRAAGNNGNAASDWLIKFQMTLAFASYCCSSLLDLHRRRMP